MLLPPGVLVVVAVVSATGVPVAEPQPASKDAVSRTEYNFALRDMTVNLRDRQKLLEDYMEQARKYVNSKGFLVEMEEETNVQSRVDMLKERMRQ